MILPHFPSNPCWGDYGAEFQVTLGLLLVLDGDQTKPRNFELETGKTLLFQLSVTYNVGFLWTQIQSKEPHAN